MSYYPVDMRFAYFELDSKEGWKDSFFVPIADFFDLRGGKLGPPMLFTFSLSTFTCLISHIVALTTKKQMQRVNTRGVITLMEDKRTISWANKDTIASDMGIYTPAIAHAKSTISKLVFICGPFPAPRLSNYVFLRKIAESLHWA